MGSGSKVRFFQLPCAAMGKPGWQGMKAAIRVLLYLGCVIFSWLEAPIKQLSKKIARTIRNH